MTLEELGKEATRFGVYLSESQLNAFSVYSDMLLTWNQRMNLTAIVEPDEIVVRHFLDSLSCFLVLGRDVTGRLVDIGTGAGLPGLALKIAAPQLDLTLVDSVAKKTDFVKAVVEALMLERVTVLADRAEDMGRTESFRDSFDWAVARSVAHLPTLLEYLLPLVHVGGAVLAMKGESASEELASAQEALAILGGGSPRIKRVYLPGRDTPHHLIWVRKERQTPERYPRRPGMPAKRPL